MAKSRRVFKYVSFSEHVLSQLVMDQVFYANPASFNDPLDCQPVVTADLDVHQLKELVAAMVLRRSDTELRLALRQLRLKGDNAESRVRALSHSQMMETLREIEYLATDPDVGDPQEYIRFSLTTLIQEELRRGYERGVCCLSRRWDSVLMWSHYADQHRGLCIEYDASPLAEAEIYRVNYDTAREIPASVLYRLFITVDESVRPQVDRAALLTKSREWRYEREVRVLSRLGPEDSPFTLKGVIFGMHCPYTTQFVIAKSLEQRADLQFWNIRQPSKGFRLQRARADLDEAMATLPRETMMYAFQPVEVQEE
jgi:Protein of unknown function (DUF2971)